MAAYEIIKKIEMEDAEGNSVYYYVGRTADIKAMFKSIAKAVERGVTNLYLPFSNAPIFSDRKNYYALEFVEHDNCTQVSVVNSDTMLGIMLWQ